MANQKPTHVVTGVARLSYCALTSPRARDGQEPKYQTTILIPKSDTATMQRVNAAIEAATQDGAKRLWGGRPPKVALPIYDGDGVRPSDGQPYGPECKGHYVFTASSKMAPEVVDMQRSPIIRATEIYSGMYARVSVDFFPYMQQGKKGVGVGLGNVQKVQDGEPLGGRTSAEDDFGDGSVPATAQPAYAPPAYQQPVQPAYQQPAYAPPAYQPQPEYDIITGQPLT